MKLALSCTAEGLGHASRLIAFAEELARRHELVLFVPEKLRSHIAKSLPGSTILPIPYFAFVLRNNRVQYLRTFFSNLSKLINLPAEVARLSATVRDLDLDGVVCDYDPYLSAAARLAGVPVVQLNHPGIVVKSLHPTPLALSAQVVSLFLMGSYDLRLLVSFYDGDVGPIIRRPIRALRPTKGDHIIVYLKGDNNKVFLEKLKGLGVDRLEVFPDPTKDFAASLASCKAIISTAGHQLITEAVYLKKPLYVIPQRGQYEQLLNARMLELSGWGMRGSLNNVDRTLPYFLEHVEDFGFHPRTEAGRFDFSDNTGQVARRLEGFFLERAVKRRNRKTTLAPAAHRRKAFVA